MIACARAPALVRLPPQTLRLTTAGRMACSLAAIVGSRDRRIEQEEKPLLPMLVEMGRQALIGGVAAWWFGEVQETLREILKSLLPLRVAGPAFGKLIAHRQGLAKQLDDLAREGFGPAGGGFFEFMGAT